MLISRSPPTSPHFKTCQKHRLINHHPSNFSKASKIWEGKSFQNTKKSCSIYMRETLLGKNFLKKSINQTRTWTARAQKKGKKASREFHEPGTLKQVFPPFLMTWISGRCVACFFFSRTNSNCFGVLCLCVRRGWLWTWSPFEMNFAKVARR